MSPPGWRVPAVGGAMDLVHGAKSVVVITEHVTRDGEPKLVERCTYPLTGQRVVSRVYTDLAVVEVTPDGFHSSTNSVRGCAGEAWISLITTRTRARTITASPSASALSSVGRM